MPNSSDNFSLRLACSLNETSIDQFGRSERSKSVPKWMKEEEGGNAKAYKVFQGDRRTETKATENKYIRMR